MNLISDLLVERAETCLDPFIGYHLEDNYNVISVLTFQSNRSGLDTTVFTDKRGLGREDEPT